MINMISHDAKGIFSALGWSIDAFKKEYGDDSQQINGFQDSINMLGKLCQSMIRINNHESHGLMAVPCEFSLLRWLRTAAARAETATDRAEMTLVREFDVPDRRFVTDSSLLDRTIGNLYTNAIIACSAGAKIRFIARIESDDFLVLAIEDNGPGVPDDSVDLIFEPFFSERANGSSGDGLGLPICRLAAAALGGTVQYAPVSPNGSRFTVRVPEMNIHHA